MAVVIATWMPRSVRTRACQVGRAVSLLQCASGCFAQRAVCRLSLHVFRFMCVASLRCAALRQ